MIGKTDERPLSERVDQAKRGLYGQEMPDMAERVREAREALKGGEEDADLQRRVREAKRALSGRAEEHRTRPFEDRLDDAKRALYGK